MAPVVAPGGAAQVVMDKDESDREKRRAETAFGANQKQTGAHKHPSWRRAGFKGNRRARDSGSYPAIAKVALQI